MISVKKFKKKISKYNRNKISSGGSQWMPGHSSNNFKQWAFQNPERRSRLIKNGRSIGSRGVKWRNIIPNSKFNNNKLTPSQLSELKATYERHKQPKSEWSRLKKERNSAIRIQKLYRGKKNRNIVNQINQEILNRPPILSDLSYRLSHSKLEIYFRFKLEFLFEYNKKGDIRKKIFIFLNAELLNFIKSQQIHKILLDIIIIDKQSILELANEAEKLLIDHNYHINRNGQRIILPLGEIKATMDVEKSENVEAAIQLIDFIRFQQQ